MSQTELYAFDAQGYAYPCGETPNAWRGAMAVWDILEQRHLPQYIPYYVKACRWYRPDIPIEEIKAHIGFTPRRISATSFNGVDPMQDIWDLADSNKLSPEERIALYTTFDGALVRKEEFQKVIEAFRSFGGSTSLPKQADIIEGLLKEGTAIAVGWNQTSVNADSWENIGETDAETGEPLPYNCLTGSKHFWMFDEIGEADGGCA